VATRSCVVPISLVGDRPIVTIEGIAADPVGRVVQEAWVERDVVQCGYCQSGQIMSACALLKANPNLPNAFRRCGSTILELEAGKIRRESDYWDAATFMKQVGVLPLQ
jgi:aerobic-type carbon monoxide dehydrogenase small subunit (CoxS/CutS family)